MSMSNGSQQALFNQQDWHLTQRQATLKLLTKVQTPQEPISPNRAQTQLTDLLHELVAG